MSALRTRMWLNRERALFLAALAALAGAVAYAVRSAPDFPPAGAQRALRRAPPEMNPGIDRLARSEDIARFLAGERPNPFAHWQEPRSAPPPRDPPRGPVTVVRRPHIPRPPRPRPVRPVTPPAPKPYEVPVNFKGFMGAPDGSWYALLKVKTTGENRRLAEGDIWPETGLRIVKITQNSVLLENEKGERFLMRDPYGRKALPGGDDAAAAAGT